MEAERGLGDIFKGAGSAISGEAEKLISLAEKRATRRIGRATIKGWCSILKDVDPDSDLIYQQIQELLK